MRLTDFPLVAVENELFDVNGASVFRIWTFSDGVLAFRDGMLNPGEMIAFDLFVNLDQLNMSVFGVRHVIPEPAAVLLIGLGLVGIGFAGHRAGQR